jgi:tRNA1(Val) A37 N6-methylase TrmN6
MPLSPMTRCSTAACACINQPKAIASDMMPSFWRLRPRQKMASMPSISAPASAPPAWPWQAVSTACASPWSRSIPWRNGLAARVSAVTLDVAAPARAFTAAGLKPGSADRVLMNPPFHDSGRQKLSAHAGRRLAHAGSESLLPTWVAAAARLLSARGTLTLIWRADGLGDVLAALGRAFGGVAVMPVHSKPGEAAVRILVRAAKQSRAPLTIHPGLMLNLADGGPAAVADAVLRGRSVLPFADL